MKTVEEMVPAFARAERTRPAIEERPVIDAVAPERSDDALK